MSACKVCGQEVPDGDELCGEDIAAWEASGEYRRWCGIPTLRVRERMVALFDFVTRIRAERGSRRAP